MFNFLDKELKVRNIKIFKTIENIPQVNNINFTFNNL